MKKTLIILEILFLFSACRPENKRVLDISNHHYIITIDSCEYIATKAPEGDYGWVMTHKGNCKNH